MSVRLAGVVFRKEWTDGVRDRRSLITALMVPLMLPLFLLFTLQLVVDRAQTPDSVELPIAGSAQAPNLVRFLGQQGITAVDPPSDPERAVRAGAADMVLVIPEDFKERWSRSEPARLRLYFDSARDDKLGPVQVVTRALRSYAAQVGTRRLMARGVSPSLATPIQILQADVASPQQSASRALALLPMLVLLATFIGGMNIAVDTTAGERERGSLEPLLLNPVPRQSLVLGKWLTSSAFAGLASILCVLTCGAVLHAVSLEEIDIQLELGARTIGSVLCAIVPLAPLAAGMELLLATFARSFKEAQTTMSVVTLLPMVPALLSMSSPVATEAWMMGVPMLSQQRLVVDALAARSIPVWMFLVSALVSVTLGYLSVLATTQLFKRERVIYGR